MELSRLLESIDIISKKNTDREIDIKNWLIIRQKLKPVRFSYASKAFRQTDTIMRISL
ncbi:MAG: hypothetical protein U5K84_11650 [Alkalibacterium sp.]|nr:hypothetical protein [Alkalibacterium sp.]